MDNCGERAVCRPVAGKYQPWLDIHLCTAYYPGYDQVKCDRHQQRQRDFPEGTEPACSVYFCRFIIGARYPLHTRDIHYYRTAESFPYGHYDDHPFRVSGMAHPVRRVFYPERHQESVDRAAVRHEHALENEADCDYAGYDRCIIKDPEYFFVFCSTIHERRIYERQNEPDGDADHIEECIAKALPEKWIGEHGNIVFETDPFCRGDLLPEGPCCKACIYRHAKWYQHKHYQTNKGDKHKGISPYIV